MAVEEISAERMAQRRREYVAWGEEVINELLGTNETLERYFEDLCSKAKQKFEEVEKNQ